MMIIGSSSMFSLSASPVCRNREATPRYPAAVAETVVDALKWLKTQAKKNWLCALRTHYFWHNKRYGFARREVPGRRFRAPVCGANSVADGAGLSSVR